MSAVYYSSPTADEISPIGTATRGYVGDLEWQRQHELPERHLALRVYATGEIAVELVADNEVKGEPKPCSTAA